MAAEAPERRSMSWRERDYTWFGGKGRGYRDRAGTWREHLPPPATRVLVLLHLAGFILVATTSGAETAPQLMLGGGQVSGLGVIAHPIAAPSAFTLLFVITVVWTLGGRIESHLGPRTMLALYLLGNILGGLAFVAVAGLRPELTIAPLMTPLGAMMAWTTVVWRRLSFELVAIFVKEFPLAKVAAFIAALGGVIMLLSFGLGATGWFSAAAAGMAVPVVLDVAAELRFSRRRRGPQIRARRPTPEIEPEDDRSIDPAGQTVEIDEILAKISRSGMASLTAEERSRLEEARQARLRREDEARVR